ncbi:MAG: amino acid adenylation domain-containing protein, partial [Acidobacteria bacterium]|nr:amino acid adenylation domain-containing protein [Acidobacteriota bacterium]
MKNLNAKYIENILALTPSQEGMLFHYLKNPGNGYYFEQLNLEISGEIDQKIFEKAWNIVIQANEMLRTVFRWEKVEKPSQIILKEHPCEIRFHDFSEMDDGQKKTALTEIKTKDRAEGFDLTRVPFRVILCKLAKTQYEMIVSNHHILYDGWSNGIILKEFFRFYHELYHGRQVLKFSPKPLFKEFVRWIQNQDRNRQEQHWRNYLAGFETPIELPIKRRVAETTCPGEYAIIWEEDIRGKLNVFVKNNRVTLAAVFYSAWGILLQKYCDNGDIIFGTTVSGRSCEIKGIEEMVGLFINTIPLRIQSAPGIKLMDIVSGVENILHGYSSVGSNVALFDTIVAIENYPLDDLSPENNLLSVHSYSIAETTHYDLTVGIMLFNEIEIKFSFKKELFENYAIENLAGHFKTIIQKMIEQPETALLQLEIISIEEKNRILNEFNNTAAEYPRDKTIHQLFAEKATQTPDYIALHGCMIAWMHDCMDAWMDGEVARNVSLTYHQLNEQSDRLAGLLIEKGVLPDTIIGLMIERSIEMMIGILGILKSGGAYLPIDPEYPEERIDYMLKDSGAKLLVITSDKGGEKVRRWEGKKVLLESLIHLSNYLPYHHSSFITHHSNLAYIIYTSGTTGKPKGVLIEHKNVVRLLFNDRFQFDFNEKDIWSLFHSYNFDFSVWEMYGALLYGGRLVLIPKMIAHDPEQFLQVLINQKITVLNQTPSAFYNLIDGALKTNELCLRYVIFGGEALKPARLKTWWQNYPRIKLINMFGITETCVHVTYKEIGEHEIEGDISKIGKPIPTLSTYIMDRYRKLTPIGTPGELYVGGEGVARGYLNNPELTVQRFIEHPYKNSERLYRSGDLSRMGLDGDMVYLGRIDQQVQLRGFRIELGEIENRLLKHERIKKAVVIERNTSTRDLYLCAYIVPKPGVNPVDLEVSSLREFLALQLPDYMIPSYFMPLEEIPLTANGKTDRKKLPQPELSMKKSYTAPENELQEKILEIWQEVLFGHAYNEKKTTIGIDENFFELGGHSLNATLVIAKMHKMSNVKVPLIEIFRHPTIRKLADLIIKSSKEKYMEINAIEKKKYYLLSSAQKRLYILQQMDSKNNSYNIPILLQLEGILDKDRIEKTFRKLIKRHESLRTSFYMVIDEPVQRIHDEVEFAIECFATDVHGLTQTLIKNFIRPFDLAEAPLLRVALLKDNEDRHILMIDMHHIISDGTSMNIVVKDFMALYQEEDLPKLRVQYKDFSEWQNSEKQKNSIKQQERFWVKEFEGEIPVLELPTDYLRPAVQRFEGSRIHFEIDENSTEVLKKLTVEIDITLYMLLLSIYTVFLSKISNQEDIIIGSPIAGRRHADLENIIGMFVNTLALRNFPSGEKTFCEFLYEVKEKVLKAFENQDFPYEDLVDQLLINRDISRNPLFDTMFVLQNMDIEEINIPCLKLSPYPYENKTSKFDLILLGVEKENKVFFTFEYSTKLFKEKTIQRFIAYFKNVANGVIIDKNRKISDVEIITVEEKKQILFDFNDT